MRPPIFDAEKTKHPLQYLKSMKSYINASNLDHEEMLYVLSQSLQGTASTWWQITSQSINEYDDFEKKFKARYWSQSEQRECARKIEFGKFSLNGKPTRVQYATEIWSMAQELGTEYTEAVLVDKLSLHFD